MDNSNISDLPSFHGYGERLMSESPLPRSSSLDNRDTTEADLSLSELSVAEPPRRLERFSLLAPGQQDSHRLEEGDSLFSDVAEEVEPEDEEEEVDGDEDHTLKREQDQRAAAQTREEKLRSDIFVLRKLNSAFGLFNEALQETTSANQRIATQLVHTDALLNKYIEILSKSDKYSHLIFDEQWEGAEEDELVLERERLAEIERKKKEAEERERARLASRLEEERRRKEEEEERLRQEEAQKLAAAKPTRGSTRGGTTRGRISSRIGVTGGGSRGRVATSTRGISSTRGTTTARPSSSTSSRLTRT